MESQVKWGIGFIVIGLILSFMAFAVFPIMIYGIPVTLVGIALILFREREKIIEEVKE